MANGLEEFQRGWAGKKEPSVGEKVKNAFKTQEPLRHRLVMAQYKLKTTLNRLDVYVARLQERDRTLFERVVDAVSSKDKARASMYSNEVAELRKISKQLIVTQIALEQVSLRLETVISIGDVFTNLQPIVAIVSELKGAIKAIMPEIGLELTEIQETLEEVVTEAGEFTGGGYQFAPSSAEARKILEEASVVAESRMKEKFPDLPSFVTGGQETSMQHK
jgi:division protein CdvB (Snf7/Vps24/ESCRT-III family)